MFSQARVLEGCWSVMYDFGWNYNFQLLGFFCKKVGLRHKTSRVLNPFINFILNTIMNLLTTHDSPTGKRIGSQWIGNAEWERLPNLQIGTYTIKLHLSSRRHLYRRINFCCPFSIGTHFLSISSAQFRHTLTPSISPFYLGTCHLLWLAFCWERDWKDSDHE